MDSQYWAHISGRQTLGLTRCSPPLLYNHGFGVLRFGPSLQQNHRGYNVNVERIPFCVYQLCPDNGPSSLTVLHHNFWPLLWATYKKLVKELLILQQHNMKIYILFRSHTFHVLLCEAHGTTIREDALYRIVQNCL
jgi:hypothetical protein